MKPHRAIFERALGLLEVAADEAVMVGDQLHADVWGAKCLGLRAVWYQSGSAMPQNVGGIAPDATISELADLAAVLESWRH